MYVPPQLDGLELAGKALRINPNVKTILISAFDKFEYEKQAVRLGAFDYVEKPLDYSYLTLVKTSGHEDQFIRLFEEHNYNRYGSTLPNKRDSN